MQVARRIYEQYPDVLFVVTGADKPHYGSDKRLTGGRNLRSVLLDSGEFDLSRFHFTGWVPEQTLIDVLSLSDLHIYLTVPFITSWSMLDAMSCGCVVLASDQACTREYIVNGENGFLVDFFDVEAMAARAVEVLRDPGGYAHVGAAARRTIEEKYSLDVNLPRLKRFFEDVASRPRQPSVRAELLVREGTRSFASTAHRGTASVAAADPRPFDGHLPYFIQEPQASGHLAGPAHPEAEGRRSESKTVLFAWELGAGLGHLMQMRPLVEELRAAGHCVVVALRHLDRAVDVFGHAGVFYLQAPYKAAAPPRFRKAACYAQHLANLGFGNDNGLFGFACAWRNLIRTVAPDAIVCDYAPVALLASRAFAVRRVVIGSGFCVPPDVDNPGGKNAEVWAPLRPAVAAATTEACRVAEAEVLARTNWVLGNWGQAPLDRLGQLFGDVDEQFLTTFPELDHFAGRHGVGYWGPVIGQGVGDGGDAKWPNADGLRVFAYLKATPEVETVLGVLKRAGYPTVAYIDGLAPSVRRRLQGPTLHIASAPLDVGKVSRECGLAVTNGGHGVTAEMLLAGKPLMVVPLVLEQQQTGRAVERMGAGLWAAAREHDAIVARLLSMLEGKAEPWADSARAFARRYAAFDGARQRRAMSDRLEQLLATNESVGEHPDRAARIA